MKRREEEGKKQETIKINHLLLQRRTYKREREQKLRGGGIDFLSWPGRTCSLVCVGHNQCLDFTGESGPN